MTHLRRAPALLVLMLFLAVPAISVAASPSSHITPQAPSWLSRPSPPSSPSSLGSGPAPVVGRTVPRTGFDLLPEALAGASLIAAGSFLRRRRA